MYVNNSEVVYQKVLDAGATPVTRLTKLAFGDVVERVCYPLGNIWRIQERVENVSEQQISEHFEDGAAAAAMKYVQKSLDNELRKRTSFSKQHRGVHPENSALAFFI